MEALDLCPGDAVLFMTDGLPERFNHQGQMFEYAKVTAEFLAAAHGSPQEIIARLVEAGDAFAGPRPPDDDITLVVIKAC
ncbi:MAG: SpoIIE family protein phosphatase [Bryobacteraceae bacterium]|nr:SpoIIE family protein phosphatase [Bryobacteraceae bacterium]